MRRLVAFLAAASVLSTAALTAGCSTTPDDPAHGPGGRAAPGHATIPRTLPSATRHAERDCASTPPSGTVVRTGYGLNYTRGSIHAGVRPDAGRPVCVRFAKSGPADPQVPVDMLLFTFAGPDGEGAQVEFRTTALTGGVLPPLGDGYYPTVGPLNHPVDAAVGISVDGVYYHSDRCALRLTTVTALGAAGRFDCPRAIVREANPFAPSDDTDPDTDDLAVGEPVATLSGWFSVTP
ncbi:MAG: hypothetical protein QM809_00170 [Gordonia sp. (in: high G+C Gram-positive bacteria)]|uniref:hypothetical protein n=1 Tax=Gordonia sp. (in: high G+C Gram-positive bacteria) TaxID=84139 RepID=UPI0039E55805